MASLTIPLKASKKYKSAFKAYADDHNRQMADLVREALDAQYGDDLQRYLSFFDSSDAQKHQSMPKRPRKESAR